MWTSLFWKDTVERVISTAAQAAIGVLTADGVDAVNIDLEGGLAVIGIAAAVSFLKAIVAGSGKISDDTVSPASLAQE